MSLEVDIDHRQGAFRLEASFRSSGRLTALFGRSGSGKTTLVNAIAGLVRPARGRIAVDGAVLVDTAAGVAVPTHRRRIGYVFQEGRLFPHLTVRQNLLFGRWLARGRQRGDRKGAADFDTVVALLGIGLLLARRPGALSGGEKQRVAIGRALLAHPRLLLMDEPLASLDEARKAEILPYLERLRDEAGVPIVYVSHALAEVARLATTVVVLDEGRVAAVGSTAEVLGRLDLPAVDPEGAGGAVLEATVAAHDDAYGLTLLATPAGTLQVPRLDLPPGAATRAHVRARDVMLSLERPKGISALNVLAGRVVEVSQPDGASPTVAVRLDCGGATLTARITRRSLDRLGLVPGRAVHAVIKSVSLDRGGRRAPERAASGTRTQVPASDPTVPAPSRSL
jgi:molybdate transport system ATP-binding protein